MANGKDVLFKNSPLNELICGIHFDSKAFDFRVENDFYRRVEERFPEISKNIPLLPREDFPQQTPLILKIPPGLRYFFASTQQNKLIQLQEGKYFFNWRKIEENEAEYPRFKGVYKEFKENWTILKSILNLHQINFNITGTELSYVDHIYLDLFEGKTTQIQDIFTFINNVGGLSRLDSINFSASFPLTSAKGQLSITLNNAIRNKDRKPLLILQNVIKGSFDKEDELDEWFEKAHDDIIANFLMLITEKAKTAWKLQQ